MKYGRMTLSVEWVTPAIALAWLQIANRRNRRLRRPVASQYARDMAAGKWVEKPVAICFCEDGSLGNGQHTLTAIVESGCAQWLLIARNVPESAIAAMDVGIRRTISDIAHFVGSEFGSRESAVARVIAYGPADRFARSFSDLFDVYETHRESIDWVCSLTPKKTGFSTPTLAVLARAWYTEDADRIRQFVDALKSGVITSQADSAAIRLREFCRNLRGSGGQESRVETYRRTQSALSHFLQHKPMTKLYGTETELFPIPASSLRRAA